MDRLPWNFMAPSKGQWLIFCPPYAHASKERAKALKLRAMTCLIDSSLSG